MRIHLTELRVDESEKRGSTAARSGSLTAPVTCSVAIWSSSSSTCTRVTPAATGGPAAVAWTYRVERSAPASKPRSSDSFFCPVIVTQVPSSPWKLNTKSNTFWRPSGVILRYITIEPPPAMGVPSRARPSQTTLPPTTSA